MHLETIDSLRLQLQSQADGLIVLADKLAEATRKSALNEVGPNLAYVNRRLIEIRRLRRAYFDVDLIDEATWGILSVLYDAYATSTSPVRLVRLVEVSGVTMTTALNRLAKLSTRKLVVRHRLDTDLRQNLTELSAAAISQFEAYLAAVGP